MKDHILIFALFSLLVSDAYSEISDPQTTFSLGLSHPLVLSTSIGQRIGFNPRSSDHWFKSKLGLQADVTAGIGGGIVGVGLVIPVQNPFYMNIQLARMRTWLWPMSEPINENYNGVIINLDTFGHSPFRFGFGTFTNVSAHKQNGPDIFYFFGGLAF